MVRLRETRGSGCTGDVVFRNAKYIKDVEEAAAPHTLRVQVEVTDIEELRQALDAGAGAVLLDNMPDDALREAVRLTAGRAVLEASGGITENRLRSVAATGVGLISAGALTHSAPAVDLSFLFEK